MKVMGIRFAPFYIPLSRRLQTLAAGAAFATMIFGGVAGAIFLIYLILYTHHWPEALMYLIWAYVIDTDTPERGGRRMEWVRDWAWWRYVKEYFPIHFERVPWAELDPKRNYLFCFFPHGILPTGFFSAFGSNSGEFHELFPNHTPYPLTLKQNFLFPILRELLLAVGMCSASAQSLNWILGSAGGGKVAALVIGGAAETFNCRPGQYRIILKQRKGFSKIALKNGTPLVPVFSFGETDLFNQLDNPEGSVIRRIQEWLKGITGIAFPIPLGRGFLQYSFGMVPLRKHVSTIVGRPIEVKKVEYPTQEQIDTLHGEFMAELIKLFEEQKYNYLSNPQDTTLIID